MEIKNLRKIDGTGKTKAFFSVCWPGKLIINDLTWVQEGDRFFVGMPSQTYKDKEGNTKYKKIVVIEDINIQKQIHDAVVKIYGMGDKPEKEDIPF
jgi:DNA-binding cell septation regulator SpoVG